MAIRNKYARRAVLAAAARQACPHFGVLEALEERRLLSAVYTVINTNDNGSGSLRNAIIAADANPGSTIDFANSLAGQTISLDSALPAIMASMTIDASGISGYHGTPLVEIDGSSVVDTGSGTVGLEIDASGVTVKGLAIDNFTMAQIHLAGAGGDTIQGDYLGLNSSNEVGNPGDGIIMDSAGNLLGGSSASDRNVISGNPWDGVVVNGDGNQIIGNYIGTDPTGTYIVYNNNNGITVNGAANTIIVGNLISGNNGYGIDFESDTAGGNVVAGNFIGTDVTGTLEMGNSVSGIYLYDSSDVLIGGTAGVPTNLAAGGVSQNAGNLISGNFGDGVTIVDSSYNTVEGNYIGTDVTGTLSKDANNNPLGNSGNGITILSQNTDAQGNVISGNLISNNQGDGVNITTLNDYAASNIVQGNMIGTDASGTVALGNAGNGVSINGNNSVIGGAAAGDANVIDYNGLAGVTVYSGNQNSIRGNSIYGNAHLGIDLGGNGVVINDSQGHSGANNYQDFPLITTITNDGTTVGISGTLRGQAADSSYVLDFYSSATGDASGYGQGQVYLGSVTVTTDGHGNATFSVNFTNVAAGQTVVAATATDTSGNTSEFSASQSIPAAVIVSNTPVDTSMTLVSSDPNSFFGESITFTATVTPDSGDNVPTGTVTFMDGSTVLGTGTLDSNGMATLTLSDLDVNSHNITAIYGGDSNDVGCSQSMTQNVAANNTTTTLISSSATTYFGQAVTFTATVAVNDAGNDTPGGTVTFMDGDNVLGTASVGSNGTAVLVTSSMAVGDHTITAVYSGDTNDAPSTSAPLSQTVNAIQTNTTLTSSTNPSVYGQGVTLTATVTAQMGSGTPTGSVLFMDGNTVLGTATVDANGVAMLTLSNLTVGGHAITATYSGDANDVGSSASLAQNVNQSQTATTLISSTASTTYGQQITFTATVSIADMGAGMPTGIVTFYDGDTAIGTGTLNANGVATLSVSDLAVGSHTITASYSGDTNFTSSVSGPVSENVNQIQTATTLISSLSSSVYGQSVTFTAMVIAASGATPTGSVVFMDGSTVLGTVVLDSNGMASLTLSTLSVGSHPITVTYGGSATDAGSGASLTQNVGKDNTSTTLISNADPSVYGQAITLTATVTGSGQPTGNVVFMDGTTVLGTAAVGSNGVATISLSDLAVGAHSITASYAGDATDNGSSASLTQNVNKDRTTTTLVLSATSTDFGQSVIFTATVNIADLGSGTPTGTVTFYDGTTVVGTANLGANGSSSITCSTLSVGTDAITAEYSGDGNFAGSISNTVDEAVDLWSTSTSLTSSADPSYYGQSVLFTATVSGGEDETGTITFTDASTGNVLGTVAINSNGVATLNVSSLAVGGHAITAAYSGDSANATSSASLNQTVNQNTTATALTSNASSVTYGQSVTFTATVSLTSDGSDTPTGNVVFMDGTKVLGTVAINSSGVAILTVSNLSVGGHAITATYSGDANDAGSSNSLIQMAVQRTTTTTLVTSLTPSFFGQSVTFTATVSYGGGAPTGSVTFWDGSTNLGTVAINSSGVATLTDAALAAGSHTITASYGGDTNDASSSASLTQGVNQDVTKTTIASSVNPSVYGQSVTFTATLTNMTLGGAQAGSITFMDGSTVLGTVAVNGSGVATLTISNMAVGGNAITASFAGNANVAASSAALTQTVNKDSTTTTLASTANPSFYGQSITLTATVAGYSPTGSVVFMDGGTVLGTISLSSGKATLTLSTLALGSNSITTTYSGDTNNATSSGSLNQTVNKNTTSTTVVSSNSSSTSGQSVTFTATVSLTSAGSDQPGGTVTFMNGSTTLGTGTLNSSGVATFTTSSLAVGSYTITATYGGDAKDVGSSGTVAQTVNAAVGSISGYTLNDITGNGISSDDTTLAGVKVELFLEKDGSGVLDSGDGSAIATVTTGANGSYSFGNLAKGTYFVEEVTPTGYVETAPVSDYYTLAVNGNTYTNEDFDNYNTAPNNSCNVTCIRYTDGCHTFTTINNAPIYQGDTLSVTFTIPRGCSQTLSFVSYTCPDPKFYSSDAYEQMVYSSVTGTYTCGTYTLTIKVPPCYFQVDFVMGDVINQFGSATSNVFYSAQNRLIDSDNGGTTAPSSSWLQ